MAKRNYKYGIRYTDAQKARGVRLAEKLGQSKAAEMIGCTPSALRKWQVADGVKRTNTATFIPTTERKKQRRSKALVAVGYKCPHCDGLIEVNQ